MNYITTNRELCSALGLDPDTTRQVSIVLVPDDVPRVRAERYVTSEFQRVVVDRYVMVQQDVLADLLELAKQYAGDCVSCHGGGGYYGPMSGTWYPCSACSDIRAVIDKAEGRA